jgi:hypothetical protein
VPGTYSLDRPGRIVRSRAWGALTEADFIGHLEVIAAHFQAGTLDASWGQIADFTDVTSVAELTTAGIRKLAARNPWPRGVARVVVAPRAETYQLGRMYQMMADLEPERLHVVRTLDEALEWMAEKGHQSSDPSELPGRDE